MGLVIMEGKSKGIGKEIFNFLYHLGVIVILGLVLLPIIVWGFLTGLFKGD